MGRRKLALAAAGIVVLSVAPLSAAPAAVAGPGSALDVTKQPNAIHASVENEAMVLGNGAVSLFVDPGTAYSLASIDYTRFADDAPADSSQKAVAAVLNPGTIGGAVLWATPNGTFPGSSLTDLTKGDIGCDGSIDPATQAVVTPNSSCMLAPTGVEEAAGFPGYSEAFAPVETTGIDRQHTAKCLWSKDSNQANPTGGALGSTCRNDLEASPAYATADVWPDRLESRGFTRIAGATGSTLLSVGASESLSQIYPTATGKLVSKGYATASNISLANGVVEIGAIKSVAEIQTDPGTGDPDVATARCTATGVKVAGGYLPVDPSLDPNSIAAFDQAFTPLHDAALAQGFDVEIIPPSLPTITTTSTGKHTATCHGIQVIIDDVRPTSNTSSRQEYTFGFINVAATSNVFEPTLTDIPVDTSGATTDLGSAGVSDSGTSVLGSSVSDSFVPSALPSTSSGSTGPRTGAQSGTGTGNRATTGSNIPTHRLNKVTIAVLTTTTAATIGAGIWLLIGVVLALAQGTRLRLPGTRMH